MFTLADPGKERRWENRAIAPALVFSIFFERHMFLMM